MSVLTGIDAGRWPDVATSPAAGAARLRAARTAVGYAARVAGVRVMTPDGPLGAGPGALVLEVRRAREFFARIGRDGLIGFGEGYMSGAWTASDLTAVLTAFASRLTSLVPPPLQKLRRLVQSSAPAAEVADRAGARRNVSRHYDLSNDLFALFLDPTMTYSSALFAPGDDLERAQLRKIDAVLDAAAVRPGARVLEIGTGWGALAVRAATERGAHVTSVTLSEEQARLARSRAHAAGVADLVDVQVRDYRDVRGRYDAVASVEMIEAVGERHWPDYFAALGRALLPGGRVGLQAITMPHEHLLATRHSWTWMHKYVFPGGLIPSDVAIRAHALRDGGLTVLHRRSFGAHYAETLRQWRERFQAAADAVAALGFDPVFQRMWEFYLAYCEAGFHTGRLDVEQYTLSAGGVR
ncbi:class I SAM-dependent methyltransferase [Jiangella alkaliphila]|uniref:Cyclopropane-fatty-acyl-phospholipid synthase n=1 Tax=Jiangella alkaliphila TaxID=419479 RepID=A0A1H2LF65_9ACTN|nr:class I SAM-dependent methyltransferase [Jiangella alkaliphila]SDU79549.1 cyclopropane-fatty-acyl-phospholipid synthase [Jiangella alkaliphila]